jgi:hypothetical protein
LFEGFWCGVGLGGWFGGKGRGEVGLGCLWRGRRSGFLRIGLGPRTILLIRGWGMRIVVIAFAGCYQIYNCLNYRFNSSLFVRKDRTYNCIAFGLWAAIERGFSLMNDGNASKFILSCRVGFVYN